MKKMFLILSVIIGLTVSYSSYAKSYGNRVPVKSTTAIRLAWVKSDSSWVYCYYQRYNINTGAVVSTYERYYIKGLFKGCPAR